MNAQVLMGRISECVDQLGLMLDQIYKFTQKQRQSYFDRIQSMKNKLLGLKAVLRESNTTVIEKQYKKLYLTTNALKNQIQNQLTLIPSVKENKEINRYRDIKDVRKNYEQTMKLLLVKDEELKNLRELLLQKQQMLRLNEQEHMALRQDYQIMLSQTGQVSYNNNNYEVQLQRTNNKLKRAESQVMQLTIRQKEKDVAFNSAILQLENLRVELMTANQRIINLEHLVQVNKTKNIMAEQTFGKTDKKNQAMNDSFLKEHNSFRKLRQVSELQYELESKNVIVRQLQQQNKHLKQDIQVLQNEISKLKNKNSDQQLQSTRQKQNMLFDHKRIEKELQSVYQRQNQLKKLLDQVETKYHVSINKLNSSEEFKVKLKESDFQNELLQQKINNFEAYIDKLQGDIKELSKSREKLLYSKDRDDATIRQLEVDVIKAREKIKMRDEDLSGLSHELESYKNRVREYQRELTLKQKKQRSIESNLIEQKTRIIKMQQKDKARSKEVQGLKIKLLRAKLETIHQIRETIN